MNGSVIILNAKAAKGSLSSGLQTTSLPSGPLPTAAGISSGDGK